MGKNILQLAKENIQKNNYIIKEIKLKKWQSSGQMCRKEDNRRTKRQRETADIKRPRGRPFIRWCNDIYLVVCEPLIS